jgi:hypothetical protein
MNHLVQDNEYAEVWCGEEYDYGGRRDVYRLDDTTCVACLAAIVSFGARAHLRLKEVNAGTHKEA